MADAGSIPSPRARFRKSLLTPLYMFAGLLIIGALIVFAALIAIYLLFRGSQQATAEDEESQAFTVSVIAPGRTTPSGLASGPKASSIGAAPEWK